MPHKGACLTGVRLLAVVYSTPDTVVRDKRSDDVTNHRSLNVVF